jgi:hypothetical protein
MPRVQSVKRSTAMPTDDLSSLRTAIRGAYGAFSVQPALIPPTFAENELQRGCRRDGPDLLHPARARHAVAEAHGDGSGAHVRRLQAGPTFGAKLSF